MNFTGGLTELFDLTQKLPDQLFEIMLKSVERRSLMGCSIDVSQRRARSRQRTSPQSADARCVCAAAFC